MKEQKSKDAFQRNKTYTTDIQQRIKNKDIAQKPKRWYGMHGVRQIAN